MKKLNIEAGKSISDFKEFVKYLEMKNKVYKAMFRGKGPIFDGFADYSPDDDAQNIDWKTSARANKLVVKKYMEERELNFIFVVDISDSMVSGSGKKLKCEYAGDVIAGLGSLITDSRDKIGLLTYDGKTNIFIPPSLRKEQLNYIIESLSNPHNYGGKSNLAAALEFIAKNFSKRTDVIMFFSDFIHFNKALEKELGLVSSEYETLAFMIKDRLDKTLPEIDREVIIENPESSEQLVINPVIARRRYEKFAAEQENTVKSIFKRNGIDMLELVTDKPFVVPMMTFFEQRIAERGVFLI